MKHLDLRAHAGLLLLAGAPLALAHHSGAMFDEAKEVTLQGTIKEFQYTNPHSWVLVNTVDAKGKVTVWSFETRNASALLRSGIRKGSLVAGDKVTVKGHPLRDGRPGAVLVIITKADGTVLKPI
jgi:hypothetical protein